MKRERINITKLAAEKGVDLDKHFEEWFTGILREQDVVLCIGNTEYKGGDILDIIEK